MKLSKNKKEINIAKNIKTREITTFKGNLLNFTEIYKKKGIPFNCLYNTPNTIAYHEGHISRRRREAVHQRPSSNSEEDSLLYKYIQLYKITMVKITDFEYMKQAIQILQLQWCKKFPRICSRKILTLASFSLGESQNQYTIALSNQMN